MVGTHWDTLKVRVAPMADSFALDTGLPKIALVGLVPHMFSTWFTHELPLGGVLGGVRSDSGKQDEMRHKQQFVCSPPNKQVNPKNTFPLLWRWSIHLWGSLVMFHHLETPRVKKAGGMDANMGTGRKSSG